MKNKSVEVERITFNERRQVAMGRVEVSMLREDEQTRNNISFDIRVEARKDDSLLDIQGKILEEAKKALSNAQDLLNEVTPETLAEYHPTT